MFIFYCLYIYLFFNLLFIFISDEEEDYEEMLQKGLLEKNEKDRKTRMRGGYASDSGEKEMNSEKKRRKMM